MLYRMAAIFDRMTDILGFWVEMMSYHQTDVRLRILVDDLPGKMSSYVIYGALFQNYFFETGPAAIWDLALWRKKRQHFLEGPGAKYII